MKQNQRSRHSRWFGIWFLLGFISILHAQVLQTLYSFNSATGTSPYAGLTLGNDGNFYGTAQTGGAYDLGTVFKVTTNGTLTTLASFDTNSGANPYGALALGADGNFYGTTFQGGAGGCGTVFMLTTNGNLFTLASFFTTNGANPRGTLVRGSDGAFYGTTEFGGQDGFGTVFRASTDGTLVSLASFSYADGAYPYAGLALGDQGSYYGSATGGGTSLGTVFRASTNGSLVSLYSFPTAAVGNGPNGLVYDGSGSFYGTTQSGGTNGGSGTAFKISTNGVITTLHSFGGWDGGAPYANLLRGPDGALYGSTYYGGTHGVGTIYQITTNGQLTTLISFNISNGAYPFGDLALGPDGNFYGTTVEGGAYDSGTMFRLSLVPAILVQPQSQAANRGAAVAFSVGTSAPSLVTYQWLKNGTNLLDGANVFGSTTSMFTITNVSDTDAGDYSVIVSNAFGSVSSSNATLTVIDPPLITAQPRSVLVLAGTNVAFDVSVIPAAGVSFQWQFNGSNVRDATNEVYSISSVGTNDAGTYAVLASNEAGPTISSNATLGVVFSPQGQTNYALSTATFSAPAFSPEPVMYQWQRNGTDLQDGPRIYGATSSTLNITGVSDADAGSYAALVSSPSGTVTTSNALLTVNDNLFIVSQPLSQTVDWGDTVTFSVIVYGAAPFVFQWYFNGTPLGSPVDGTNSSSLTLTNVNTAQAGNYTVLIVNPYGSLMSSNAVLAVTVVPPSIQVQPLSQSVVAGSRASFSVSVTGTAPLSYQWRFNGADLPGATNSAFEIEATGLTNAGNYAVIVTNFAGSVTSSNALLTVIIPPTLALRLSAGYPLLNLTGTVGSNFVVQYSTDLNGSNWTNLLSLTNLSSSPYLFLDPSPGNQPVRFYRAFMW